MATLATQKQEKAVGISAYVAPDLPGFDCTFKHRYTDFLVNEIVPNGTVLYLTNDRVIKKEKQAQEVKANGDHAVKVEAESNDAGEKSVEKRKRDEGQEQSDEAGSSPSKKQRVNGEDNAAPPVVAKQESTDTPQANVKLEAPDTSLLATNAERKALIISEISDQDKSTLHGIFGENTTDLVFNLYANVLMRPDRKPRDQPTVLSETIAEKATRTAAHGAIRAIFFAKLETETMQDMPGTIRIRAAAVKGPTGPRARQGNDKNGAIAKGKMGWDDLGGEYLHFTLYKENKDTMEVLHFLATQLKVPARNFQFAGTKDRRAVTAQRVAIFRVYAERMEQLNKTLRNARLGDFEYKTHGLQLGELAGNEFLLTLRDVRASDEEGLSHAQKIEWTDKVLAQATECFRENGFLNYYGLQRFGTFSTGTHATGLKMLKCDLEGAIKSILAYPEDLLPEIVDTSETTRVPQDDINRADAIRIWNDTSSANDATAKLPRRFQAESAIIQFLGRKDKKTGKLLSKNDWQGALMQISRNLRLMYVHAYQSFVWNTVVGRRWDLYGGRVVEGDLVIVGEKDGDEPKKDKVDEDGEVVFHPAADDSAPSTEDSFTRARHLSKEEAESVKYDIFDVVLPLPGFDVSYPANDIGKYYEDFMGSEAGGKMDPHNMRRSWKDISLPGSYRKMLARPGAGLKYEVKSYAADEEQLVQTDLEKLNAERHAKVKPESTEAASNGFKAEDIKLEDIKVEDIKAEDGEEERPLKIAVVLKMQLGSSQYATMALRELTRGRAVLYKPDYSSR
ncbi:multisubstrate pseudouridine synthase 7 [Extremus antarcticus]|uniref:Multisubstrate pseudouridine synthase 7 n=1 Tax=Extremus antarcticus TaxID=702011 RepID=A0AAJ0GGY5_9PEZI|nr:multisubstrate pseudouridine synthase 7 [Extremus antarcticus]